MPLPGLLRLPNKPAVQAGDPAPPHEMEHPGGLARSRAKSPVANFSRAPGSRGGTRVQFAAPPSRQSVFERLGQSGPPRRSTSQLLAPRMARDTHIPPSDVEERNADSSSAATRSILRRRQPLFEVEDSVQVSDSDAVESSQTLDLFNRINRAYLL
ncbi:hypothetical protein GMRT_12757 [Giardia muris]|uniref:Uncharacterized protein n=1 Tax=Giardia muris TaxID=5742 RepID=A0A4Z1T3N5_GIAMU|nr:hypothetical protein GMRT_12757 [Giardia muris]|eukprot:TNJ28593.1 hypothetical protein GMRT_12757 [Giardia muris]